MMNNIESLDDLIAERRRLKQVAKELEADFKDGIDSINDSLKPVVSLINIPHRITSSPILASIIPMIPILGKTLRGKGTVAGIATALATELVLSKINTQKIYRIILSLFKRRK